MTKTIFRQSFLLDSLDINQEVEASDLTAPSGVTLKLHERGVLEVIPADYDDKTKNIIISCGIHGDETSPMEIIDKIISDVLSGFQTVSERCLFIIAHPEATNQHTRFIEENLNRLFDDKHHEPSREVTIADNLKRTVTRFYSGTKVETRWHLDLHCAIRTSKHYSFAVSPKTRYPVRGRALLNFVEQAHIEAVLFSNSPANTFSWFSAENFSAQALTIELGQVARIGENDLEKLVAFDLALRDLVARSEPEHLPRKPVMYRVSRTLVRMHNEFNFLFDDDVENFTSFKHGEVFGYDGEKPLMAKNEDEAIVFPNRHVVIGQRAALMVCEVSIRYDNEQAVYD
ncbi:succinylglutamate desuccinylase [Vibrio genomosp. F10]|uniref:Succinylglutamate desuccinylase n=2 Tax=Vibrio genomosp. F10 TaxID=723171 RepID=A0A1B9R057_9VIBR|nr:succinylglutamate desuccinylase [Vibrio genomosp. F10]OCH76595.1 succinylglutamate desuccinylase [Vibrio genomosp. F10]OEE34533.1 succinylglutamate desuccinylase [Vibrio genomosp. F10 str. ZF-129]OEE93392.1 succinylglutamate desuccinylase [Vibrio genomosp. F10 str. 9ZC157]OEF05656.1 succinylglutamate desuccinylase [Vibrio genomosp. F10 str. 9ZB36]